MARYTSWFGCSLRPRWLKTTLDKCQAALWAHDRLGTTCPSVGQALLSEAPSPRTRIESLVLRGLLAEVMLRRAIELRRLPRECVALLEARRVMAAFDLHESALPRINHPTVLRALRVIRKSYANPELRLTGVASMVGVTPCHLSRLLHKATRAGFADQVRQVRLKKALRLLRVAPVSVKQVAAEVGYKYAGDLARHFKRHYGMTPTAWRREHVRLRT